MRNYKTQNACENCYYCDDIGFEQSDLELVCVYEIDHQLPVPEDNHVSASGVCDDYTANESEAF